MAHALGGLPEDGIALTERKFVLAIDWGNVLYRINYKATEAALAALKISLEVTSSKQSEIVNSLERKAYEPEIFVKELQKLWREQNPAATDADMPNGDQIIAAFNALFNPETNPEIGYLYERLEYLFSLKERMHDKKLDFTLVLLSNTNQIHVTTPGGINERSREQGVADIIQIIDGFKSALFDHLFASYKIGARKGEVAASAVVVQRVLEKLEIDARTAEIYLIDDSKTYCDCFTMECKLLGASGKGVNVSTFTLEEMVEKVEAQLPEAYRRTDLEAYVAEIRTATEERFRSKVSAATKLTEFTGVVPVSGTPKSVAVGGAGAAALAVMSIVGGGAAEAGATCAPAGAKA